MSNPNFGKGNNLELLTTAYFQAHGFFTRKAVMLSISAGTADITDIDLLALRFQIPLNEEKLIVDCKNKKRSKPFERILWTLGLASYTNVDKAIVVAPQVIWQAREFASQCNIEILTSDLIQQFLLSLGVDYKPFSEADPSLAFELIKNINYRGFKDENKELAKEDLKLRQMLVIGHPLTNLNRIIKLLSHISKSLTKNPSDIPWFDRYVCFDAAIIASVMLIRFAIESKWTPEMDWTSYARKKLTYGDIPPRKAEQLAKLALDRDFFDGLPTPQYTDEINNLIQALINNQKIAAIIPFALDFYLFGKILGAIDEKYIHPVLGANQEEAIKYGKRILSALSFATGIPNSIWSNENNPLKSADNENAELKASTEIKKTASTTESKKENDETWKEALGVVDHQPK